MSGTFQSKLIPLCSQLKSLVAPPTQKIVYGEAIALLREFVFCFNLKRFCKGPDPSKAIGTYL